MTRLSRKWKVSILLFLSLGINIYFRLNTLFLPSTKIQARERVYSEVSEELYKKFSENYPDFPNPAKERFFDILFKTYLKEQKKEVK
ncbi:MAG: hypothetical protein AB1481_06300, partial [Candidatus Omnitrophota bacterium]